jgi:two-component system, NarL family, nitrate/nitrite response regulator NarL
LLSSLKVVSLPIEPTRNQTRRTRRAVRIVIAEEHPISRQSLRALVQSKAGFKVVGEAGSGKGAIAIAQKLKAGVLLLDITSSVSAGMDQLHQITQSDHEIRVLLLAPPLSRELVIRAIELGARGIVFKTATTEVLLDAIRKVNRGEYSISNEGLSSLIHAVKETSARRVGAKSKYGLTARENDIIAAVLDGFSNPDIAEKLALSEQTVKNHLSHVFDKLGVYSRLELALFAVNHHIGANSSL